MAYASWLLWYFLMIGQGRCLCPVWKTLPPTTACSLQRLHKVNYQLHHHQETKKSLPASKEEVEQGSASGWVSVLAAQLSFWAMASLVIYLLPQQLCHPLETGRRCHYRLALTAMIFYPLWPSLALENDLLWSSAFFTFTCYVTFIKCGYFCTLETKCRM